MDVRAMREVEPTVFALRRLRQIDGAEFYGLADPQQVDGRLGVIPLSVRGADLYKVAGVLSFEGGIGVRNGCFCVHPTSRAR